MTNRVAIIGVGQTYHTSKRPDVCIPELCNEAIRAALKDAELTIKDIDAVVTGNMELFEGRYHQDLWQVDYVGSYHKPGFRVTTGGTTGGTLACTAFFCSVHAARTGQQARRSGLWQWHCVCRFADAGECHAA